MRRTSIFTVLIPLLIYAAPASLQAALLTFNFTATVDSATGIWADQGSVVTGSYSYESDLVDDFPTNTSIDLFVSNSPNEGAVWDLTVTVGNVTQTSSDNFNNPGSAHHLMEVRDTDQEDSFTFAAVRVFPGDDDAAIRLIDTPAGGVDGIAPGSGSLTDTPLSTAPDVTLFETATGEWIARNTSNEQIGRLDFTVTSITLVPIPPALYLFGSGLLGLVGISRQRKAV